MSNPYRQAEDMVRVRWTQGYWEDSHGGVCLVWALRANGCMSDETRRMLHEELRVYPSYLYFHWRSRRINKHRRQLGLEPKDYRAFWRWNDVPWRRQATVVRVLKSMADKYDLSRVSQLEVEIVSLQGEVRRLKEQVAVLSTSDTWLQKVLAALREDHQTDDRLQLARLEVELAAKWDELHALEWCSP